MKAKEIKPTIEEKSAIKEKPTEDIISIGQTSLPEVGKLQLVAVSRKKHPRKGFFPRPNAKPAASGKASAPGSNARNAASGKAPVRKSSWLSLTLRWGFVAVILILAGGRYNAYVDASRQAQKLANECSKWEKTQTDLNTELARFTDPKWRESYWKWRTMRHEPGEHYIRFQDSQP
jgi:hypothetical protein